jgi:hypothetical protein
MLCRLREVKMQIKKLFIAILIGLICGGTGGIIALEFLNALRH